MLFVVCVWDSLCPRCHRYRRNYAVNKKHIANIGQPTTKKHLWTTDQGCSGCLPAGNVSSHHQLLVVLGRRRAKVFNALHVHIVDCLSVCLSVRLSDCLSVYLSVHPTVSVTVCPSICLLRCRSLCWHALSKYLLNVYWHALCPGCLLNCALSINLLFLFNLHLTSEKRKCV